MPALFGQEIVFSLDKILPTFYHVQKPIEYRLSSELRWSDLQKYNIIFLGQTKTLNILNSFFKKLHITYEAKPNLLHTIVIKVPGTDSVKSFWPQGDASIGPRQDYAIVTKIPGPISNTILIFLCIDLISSMSRTGFKTKYIDSYTINLDIDLIAPPIEGEK